MQKLATRVFIISSVMFGVLGIINVLISPDNDNDRSDLNKLIMKLWIVTVFVVLPSFALSVAGKYLNGKQ